MAESFDCPKCGAPMNYNAETQGNQDTISCPYCGESVIVPAEMRKAQVFNNLNEIMQTSMNQMNRRDHPDMMVFNSIPEAPARPKRSSSGFPVWIIAFVVIAVIAVLIANSDNFPSALQSISQSIGLVGSATPKFISDPTKKVFQGPVEVESTATEIPSPTTAFTPTTEMTPTPEVNTTATAETKATRAAQKELLTAQSQWPVILQEKFANDQRNWTTGLDNNEFALEDVSIAGNKYTWKMTTKKSMGSFSFPDMPVLTDMYISLDVQMTTTNANDYDQAGIIFRDSPKASTFYFFGINPVGNYSLTMYNGSDWSDLIPVTETNLLKPRQVNHLAVSIEGSQILLVINNIVVDSFEDAQLESGIAGVGINLPSPGEDATLIFTNFIVRAPKK